LEFLAVYPGILYKNIAEITGGQMAAIYA